MNKDPRALTAVLIVSTETKAAAGDREFVCELTPPWCINVNRVQLLFLQMKQTALVDLNLWFSLSVSLSLLWRCITEKIRPTPRTQRRPQSDVHVSGRSNYLQDWNTQHTRWQVKKWKASVIRWSWKPTSDEFKIKDPKKNNIYTITSIFSMYLLIPVICVTVS